MNPQPSVNAPIGVFDSGIGGLSVLRALQAELPRERFVYLADSAHGPYGERGDAFVLTRSQSIAAHLRRAHHIKALVVACNTATAAAIGALRRDHPELPVVGVEPALKPAVAATRTHRVGVLATRGTVESAKFGHLLGTLASKVQFVVQPCDGLADAIEQSAQAGPAGLQGQSLVATLCAEYVDLLGPLGHQPGAIDTLVLGCTHYVLAEPVLRNLVAPGVHLIETGAPVARQTRRLLAQTGHLAPESNKADLQLLATGNPERLLAAARRWLPTTGDTAAMNVVANLSASGQAGERKGTPHV